MVHSKQTVLWRWGTPLLAGLLFLLLLGLLCAGHFALAQGGMSLWISQAFTQQVVRNFAIDLGLKMVLPFYVLSGLAAWGLCLAWGSPWIPAWGHDWRSKEALGLTLSALGWMHLILWWQVPSTLWMLPGIDRLPFWLGFLLLDGASLAFPVCWLARRGIGPLRRIALLAGWLVLWAIVPLAPGHIPRLLSSAKGGQDRAAVLLVGLDGLRSDVGLKDTAGFIGTPYAHVYTPIPATRLLWNILWGGDPLYYTVGHAMPGMEEFDASQTPILLKKADAKGWHPRFYIDDGGTIGLAKRAFGFDDALRPAPGWESFFSTNISGSFPLFAAWENWGRAFPTTNPWAPLDAGLREALRQGRGSKWVMFHSCLAHQPIFLNRQELRQLPHWWALQAEGIVKGTFVLPGGVWFIQYDKPASERVGEVSVALGHGDHLEVYHPLKAGGADRFTYEGYALKGIKRIDQAAFDREKKSVEQVLTAHDLEGGDKLHTLAPSQTKWREVPGTEASAPPLNDADHRD